MPHSPSKLAILGRKYCRALGSCGAAFTFGVFSHRGRSLISEIAKFSANPIFGIRRTVPECNPGAILPDQTLVQLCEPAAVLGNVSLLESVILNSMAAASEPKAVFEIGTFDGRTTLNLAANTPPDTSIFTLDLPSEALEKTALPIDQGDRSHIEKDASGLRFAGREEARKIEQLYGDSATFDFRPYQNRMDFVFIDGAHSYEYVRSDSDTARRLLRSGRGTILWHDYGTYPGVTKALNELHASGGVYSGMRHLTGTSLCYLRL